jgi:hypothetical protein
MVIRRRFVWEEFDEESGVPVSRTEAPKRLTEQQEKGEPDATPDAKELVVTGGTQTSLDTPAPHRHIGRTYADFVSESYENPRVMAVVLTFVPFPFLAWIDHGVLISITVAAILNGVWFGFPLIERLFGWRDKGD